MGSQKKQRNMNKHEETVSVYSYIRDMIAINTLGVDAPLHITETSRRIAHIEATRNKSCNYPVLTMQEWVEAQKEVWRVSQAIRKNYVLMGTSISSEKAAELYPVNVHVSIAEYAQELAYRIARKL